MGPALVASHGDLIAAWLTVPTEPGEVDIVNSYDRCRTRFVPDRLPTLEPGVHRPSDSRMSVSEAATWLAGGDWGSVPRPLHPSISLVLASARVYPEHATAELWPLLLLSVGARAQHPRPVMWVRGVRARRLLRRDPSAWLPAWHVMVDPRVGLRLRLLRRSERSTTSIGATRETCAHVQNARVDAAAETVGD